MRSSNVVCMRDMLSCMSWSWVWIWISCDLVSAATALRLTHTAKSRANRTTKLCFFIDIYLVRCRIAAWILRKFVRDEGAGYSRTGHRLGPSGFMVLV